MKKGLVIASLVLIIVSISLTVGMFLGKLSNSTSKEEEEIKPKIEKDQESNDTEEDDKIEDTDIKEKEYLSVSMPDFIGYYEGDVANFVEQHGLTYEVEKGIATPEYHARGLIAKQSIEPGGKIEKNAVIKISVYNFDGHYDPLKEADPCHDEYGNEIKSAKLDKSKYQDRIYDAQCMDSVEESYSVGDYILNEIWKELKQSLSNDEFELLKNEQREWIADKESRNNIKEKAIMTLERCQYLIDRYYN